MDHTELAQSVGSGGKREENKQVGEAAKNGTQQTTPIGERRRENDETKIVENILIIKRIDLIPLCTMIASFVELFFLRHE